MKCEECAYIHQRPDWPHFTWDRAKLAALLSETHLQRGRLLGRMEALGLARQDDASLALLTEDVVKTSAIEGENLDENQVRSSLARRLGLDIGGLVPSDRHVEGVVEVMLDATGRAGEPLTAARLFGWHAALFPTGHSGIRRIKVGRWRGPEDDPMQVVSGRMGKERVHFEAPSGSKVPGEMEDFLAWYNGKDREDVLCRSAVAHLWLVTIHPFEDGNGRLARAVADMVLARSEGGTRRFYSVSSQICRDREAYYQILETCQRGTLDVTAWMEWFLRTLQRAFAHSESILESILYKAGFWSRHGENPLNERQRRILHQLLEGFEGNLTSSKYARINKCSHDTALRDIRALMEWGILEQSDTGGRSTSYLLKKDGPTT